MKKQRKSFRASFVVTVATVTAAAVVPACGEDVSNNPPMPDPCPADPPSVGDDCGVPGTCSYGDVCDGLNFVCSGDDWKWKKDEDAVACTPSNPDSACPTTLPLRDAPCNGFYGFRTCDYLDTCGNTITATCGPEVGQWSISSHGASCSPPAPSPCVDYVDVDACAADANCRWLVPGCGAPALPAAGCFPTIPCADGDCGPGAICSKVVINPCWNGLCSACSLLFPVCLPL